ncbi:MAG TPA: AI-2E family transporter [Methylophilaceae bacterium]|jgi:predicted PurR-regulated permease PerM
MLLDYFRRGTEPLHLTVLRDVPLFSGLTTHELNTLDDLLHQRNYVRDEIIFDQGEEGQAIYFVLSGRVFIHHPDQPENAVELCCGEFFGERALLEDTPRSAQARASEDCLLAVLFREDFLGLLHTYPQIAEKITEHCRLREAKRWLSITASAPMVLLNHREIPGPITWIGIIATTCLSLLIFKKIIWLVVPLLLSLILYYLLAPLAKKMVLSGFSHRFAATTLSGTFLLLTGLGLLMFYPLAISRANDWQTSFLQYLSGGVDLLEHLAEDLQQRFIFMHNVTFGHDINQQFLDFSEHFSDKYLGNLLLGLVNWLPSLLLTPIITFFLLKDGAYLRKMLGGAVPNAFFEKTLYLMHAVDRTARLYFMGLIKVTLLDLAMMSLGLWALGISSPVVLGFIIAVLCWIPYLGPLLGYAMVIVVAATDFPGNLPLVYGITALFIGARIIDDLLFLPMIVGKSLRIHPLLTIMMFLIGEAIAGVTGLMLVIPILGIMMVLGETLELILTDTRLQARHSYGRKLRWLIANRDLGKPR